MKFLTSLVLIIYLMTNNSYSEGLFDKRKHELKKIITYDMGKIYGYMTFENSFEKKGCYKKTGRKKKISNIFQLLFEGMPDDFSKGFNSYYAKHSNQKQLNADKIVVLNKGRIVEIGNHHDLLQNNRYHLHSQEEAENIHLD